MSQEYKGCMYLCGKKQDPFSYKCECGKPKVKLPKKNYVNSAPVTTTAPVTTPLEKEMSQEYKGCMYLCGKKQDPFSDKCECGKPKVKLPKKNYVNSAPVIKNRVKDSEFVDIVNYIYESIIGGESEGKDSEKAEEAKTTPSTPVDLAPSAPARPTAPARPSALYVCDITTPDGTILRPNTKFVKTWRLQNNGKVSWHGVKLVPNGGNSMGAPAFIEVAPAAPNAQIDVSVPLVAPAENGRNVGFFRLETSERLRFGDRVWVDITVARDGKKEDCNICEKNPSEEKGSKSSPEWDTKGIIAFRVYRCKTCGTENNESDICKICGDDLIEDGVKLETNEKSCPTCTYKNDQNSTKCAICGGGLHTEKFNEFSVDFENSKKCKNCNHNNRNYKTCEYCGESLLLFRNFGATCFINSFLQILNRMNPQKLIENPISYFFDTTLKTDMTNLQFEDKLRRLTKNIYKQYFPERSYNSQNDCQELFQRILNEEVINTKSTLHIKTNLYYGDYLIPHNNESRPLIEEEFLSLPLINKDCYIENLIQKFEIFEERNELITEMTDDPPPPGTTSMKQELKIENSDDNLLIMLKRFKTYVATDKFGIVNSLVRKMFDNIIPNNYIKIKNKTYKLDSCIIHTGDTIEHGHYFFQTFNFEGKPFAKYNDDKFSLVPDDKTYLSNGYIYLYKLVDKTNMKSDGRRSSKLRRSSSKPRRSSSKLRRSSSKLRRSSNKPRRSSNKPRRSSKLRRSSKPRRSSGKLRRSNKPRRSSKPRRSNKLRRSSKRKINLK